MCHLYRHLRRLLHLNLNRDRGIRLHRIRTVPHLQKAVNHGPEAAADPPTVPHPPTVPTAKQNHQNGMIKSHIHVAEVVLMIKREKEATPTPEALPCGKKAGAFRGGDQRHQT